MPSKGQASHGENETSIIGKYFSNKGRVEAQSKRGGISLRFSTCFIFPAFTVV